MKEFIKKNYIYLILIVVITMVMTFFMTKKEGFHEDEIFSYGSSNYVYDNVFRRFGREDATNSFVNEKILNGNIIKVGKNISYYLIKNRDEYKKYEEEFEQKKHPVWRKYSEAIDYLTVSPKETINYISVYYNQSRDVHPPLFYFCVHTISIFFLGHFSKYIVYIVNIVFMIGSLWIIKLIFETLDKKNLIIPVLILYGFSMGAISTVIFLRMYAMVTFFGLLYLLMNIKIMKDDCVIERKTWIQLGFITILGFLTQYYFCILALFIAGTVFIKIALKKDKKQIVKYILNYSKIALIGIIIFPASIYQIFFSYRGIGEAVMSRPFIDKIKDYFSLIGYSYSSIAVAAFIVISICSLFILVSRKRKNKEISKLTFSTMMTLIVSLILYVIIVVSVSPELEYVHTLRYVMPVLPLLAIVFVTALDSCFENKKVSTVVLIILVSVISVYGFITNQPSFLYEGYDKYLKIADENKNLKFVYVGDCGFCHMQSMQEFTKYSESLIIYENELEYVINDEKLKKENEFILSIKKYKGDEYILNRIVDETEFKDYELLLDDNGEVDCKIYKMKRK